MDIKPIIESLLFAAGEPLSLKKLSRIVNEKESRVRELLLQIQEEFRSQNRGMVLINKDNEWLMATIPEAASFVQKLKKETIEGDLSPSAQETLAVIAYRGPITRGEINAIRGVDATYILHQLLLRGLIERSLHPKRSNTFIYNISFAFLQHLGIKNVKELPHYEEFNKQKE